MSIALRNNVCHVTLPIYSRCTLSAVFITFSDFNDGKDVGTDPSALNLTRISEASIGLARDGSIAIIILSSRPTRLRC